LLPFLKHKQDGSMSAPVESVEREPDEGADDDYDSLESAAEDLCKAVHANDYKAVAAALRAASALGESDDG
jgi:hypothetical protein